MIIKRSVRTARLCIRTLQPDDVTRKYVDGLNDPVVNKFLVNVRARRQTIAGVRRFVQENIGSPRDALFGIFLADSGTLIGTVRLHNIDRFHYLASLGVCLFDRASWGRGYAAEALRAIVHYVFDEMGLHYIEAGVYKENRQSAALFRRAGFRIDASLKGKYRHSKGFAEVILFGKVNPSFKAGVLKRT